MRKSQVIQFLETAGGLGAGSVIFAAVLFAISLVEHLKDHNLSASVLAGAAIASFCFGAYLAWDKERKRFEELQAISTGPKLIFSATSLPDTSWNRLEESPTKSAPIFTVTHVGGDPARFIQIQRLESLRHPPAMLYVEFDQIDFLDSVKREAHPNFEMFISGQKRGKDKAGNLGYVFFHMDADAQKVTKTDYIVAVKFRWRDEVLEERVILSWDAVTQTLKTAPAYS